jgi:hypothetical protein
MLIIYDIKNGITIKNALTNKLNLQGLFKIGKYLLIWYSERDILLEKFNYYYLLSSQALHKI